ncbi:hypothetical protein [Paenibacillus sp. GYB003]|uniref:hypothetical protein n=1 Tax=Paenibacillus sp. GYB003 TaxID=2994392 RepID=UPI002F963AB5
MKPNDVSPEAGMMCRIKESVVAANPPEQDFSDRVMKRIGQSGSMPSSPRQAPAVAMKRAAVVFCVVGLLSGFSYAAIEWLDLKDKSGNSVMEVRGTDVKIPAWQSDVLKEVKKQIAPGESAVVHFGSKEEIVKRETDDILWVTSPIEYRDPDAFSAAVRGPLADSRLSVRPPDGFEFEAGYLYMDSEPQSPNEDRLIFAKTPDGKEYAYGVRKPGSGIQSVSLKFKKDGREIDYNIAFLGEVGKSNYFVEKPSKELVAQVGDTEAYYDNHSLIWVEKSEGGFLRYSLAGSAATKEELVEFARAIRPAG